MRTPAGLPLALKQRLSQTYMKRRFLMLCMFDKREKCTNSIAALQNVAVAEMNNFSFPLKSSVHDNVN